MKTPNPKPDRSCATKTGQLDLLRTEVAQEQVLERQLSARQLAMIAIGGAIGTGLFLGSGVSVR